MKKTVPGLRADDARKKILVGSQFQDRIKGEYEVATRLRAWLRREFLELLTCDIDRGLRADLTGNGSRTGTQ